MLFLVFVIVKRKEYISTFDLYHFTVSPMIAFPHMIRKIFNFVIWKIVTMANHFVHVR